MAIRLRRGTAAQWAAVNPVLATGEPGVATDTGVLKIGDGLTAWLSLPSLLDLVVDGAPGALDTLNELAAALGDDANFAATVTTALAGKQAASANLTTYAGIAPSANVQSILSAADYAAIRTLLGLVIGTNVQAYDADLTTWAGLTPSANAQSLVTAANYAAMRTLLGLVIGTNVQAWDADLDSIAALTSAANKMLYATGAQTWALADLTAAGRALIDDADAAAQRTTLGLGTAATKTAGFGAGQVPLMHASAPGTPDGTKFLRDDGVLAVPSGGGGSSATFVRKTANESVTSSTTMQDDDALTFPISANKVRAFRMVLITDGDAGDIKLGMSGPSGATGELEGIGPQTGTTDVAATTVKLACTFSISGTLAYGTVLADGLIYLNGMIRNGSTAGSCTLQWAQNNSDGTATRVKTGSYLVAEAEV